ncbi:hypothetical protein HYU16_01255 [Candidatus Woesearchaeota archaeon]|nr:hypothetical protein [Candidatus Woesearchaeota archaeon]
MSANDDKLVTVVIGEKNGHPVAVSIGPNPVLIALVGTPAAAHSFGTEVTTFRSALEQCAGGYTTATILNVHTHGLPEVPYDRVREMLKQFKPPSFEEWKASWDKEMSHRIAESERNRQRRDAAMGKFEAFIIGEKNGHPVAVDFRRQLIAIIGAPKYPIGTRVGMFESSIEPWQGGRYGSITTTTFGVSSIPVSVPDYARESYDGRLSLFNPPTIEEWNKVWKAKVAGRPRSKRKASIDDSFDDDSPDDQPADDVTGVQQQPPVTAAPQPSVLDANPPQGEPVRGTIEHLKGRVLLRPDDGGKKIIYLHASPADFKPGSKDSAIITRKDRLFDYSDPHFYGLKGK